MEIKVTYRHKKPGISLRITPRGEVNVSASYGIPIEEIHRFVSSKQEWINQSILKQQKAVANQKKFYSRLPLSTRQEKNEAVEQLHNIVSPLLQKYEKLMGVEHRSLTYTSSKTRWGSCNPRIASINFSIYLLLLPEWCIEHVVVHELAHLIEANHSSRFYAVMDKFFPRWKEARKKTQLISKD